MNETRVQNVSIKVFNLMTLMKRNLLLLSTLLSANACPAPVTADFDPYQAIIDRAPFGDLPTVITESEEHRITVEDTPPPWTEHYRMSLLMLDDDEQQPRIGLINLQNSHSFTLGINDPAIEGICLKSIDYTDQSAMVEKGGDLRQIQLQDRSIHNVRPSKSPAPLPPSTRKKYTLRQQTRTAPKLQGAALQKHLEQYQMQVIRQDLPPLPIPLTPEMDRQLVEEGFLPPINAQQ